MRLVHYGLGPIGLEVARLAHRRGHETAAAVDVDPALAGHTLGSLLGTGEGPAVVVSGSVPSRIDADAALHCTRSSLAAVMPEILHLVRLGLDVVSTCEELSYPWVANPDLASELDQAAREHRVTVLGTGVNPGFAMDFLPVVLSGPSRRVDHVRVHRVQDAGSRRLPLQRKVGAGLSREGFRALVAEGKLGHVGLRESAHHIAAALGWRLDALEETIEPHLAGAAVPSGLGEIPAGMVTGIHHTVTGRVEEREVLSLVLDMAVGLPDPRDVVVLSGDPDIEMRVAGGLHGDVATAAMVVNSLAGVVAGPPGLMTMVELPPPHP